jgi:hypothetical protein
MNHCPHCGERVDPEDAYCFECGTELTGRSEGTDQQGRREQTERHQRGADSQSRQPEADSRGRQRGRGGQNHGGGRGQRARQPGDPQGRQRGREAGYGQDTAQETDSRAESLTTLWVAAALAALAIIENVSAVLFADEIVEFVEDSGFVSELSANTVAIQGGIGAVLALAVAGLCYYYYRQGYVDRRFFWGLIAGGVAGLLFGNAFSFLILIGVGAYGLLVVLKRDQSGGQPSRV